MEEYPYLGVLKNIILRFSQIFSFHINLFYKYNILDNFF